MRLGLNTKLRPLRPGAVVPGSDTLTAAHTSSSGKAGRPGRLPGKRSGANSLSVSGTS